MVPTPTPTHTSIRRSEQRTLPLFRLQVVPADLITTFREGKKLHTSRSTRLGQIPNNGSLRDRSFEHAFRICLPGSGLDPSKLKCRSRATASNQCMAGTILNANNFKCS